MYSEAPKPEKSVLLFPPNHLPLLFPKKKQSVLFIFISVLEGFLKYVCEVVKNIPTGLNTMTKMYRWDKNNCSSLDTFVYLVVLHAGWGRSNQTDCSSEKSAYKWYLHSTPQLELTNRDSYLSPRTNIWNTISHFLFDFGNIKNAFEVIISGLKNFYFL